MTLTLAVAIAGVLSGGASLYLHWRQTQFRLSFEDADLRYEPEAVKQLGSRSAEELDDTFFDLQVELHLHNRGNGSGSIQKPRLEVAWPDGTKHVVRPDTEEVRTEILDKGPGMTRSRVWVERHGGSYFLAGRGRCDDVLDYTLRFNRGAEALAMLTQFDSLRFTLMYLDHRGREKREPIHSKSQWDELI